MTYVELTTPAYCPILTKAYHSPQALGDMEDTSGIFTRYAKKPSNVPQVTLVVGWRPRKEYMVLSMSAFCVLSLLVGIVVGVIGRDAGLGATIGGGMFALLSVVVGLLVLGK